MSKVTAVKASGSRRKQVKVFLDGKLAFGLEADMAARAGLHGRQELSEGQVEELARSNSLQRCLAAAARYLNYRPRSESELRDRLRRRGFNNDILDEVIKRLKEHGLVDDKAFAEFWRNNRQEFSPRSRRLTGLELRQKGVDRDIIDRIVGSVDDAENAYRAALSKVRSLSLSDYQGFRRRLGGYLRRRGFGYDVIDQTIRLVWQEHGRKPSEGGLRRSTEQADVSYP